MKSQLNTKHEAQLESEDYVHMNDDRKKWEKK